MPEESNRRLAAVWFADIVGYTTLSERDEDAALRLVAELQAIANREVAAHSGRVVKFVGDAVLAVFESAGSAVDGALALLNGFNEAAKAEGMVATLRLGVHVGEIHTAADGDVYGDWINTASRIQGAAGPGQVFLSSFALESVRHRANLRTESVGKRRLKGLSRSMELFVVGPVAAGDPRETCYSPPTQVKEKKPLRMGQVIGAGLLAGMAGLLGVGVFTGFGPFTPAGTPAGAPHGVDAEEALSLGKESYFRGDFAQAEDDLTRSLKLSGSILQKRQGLRYLARTQIMAKDSVGALETLTDLLSTEPPLAILIPSLEDSTLMGLYFEARRQKIRTQGGSGEISEPLRKVMVFDFQVFDPGGEMTADGMMDEMGYAVAFMVETELRSLALPTSSVGEMSFEAGGFDAYLGMDSTLVAMTEEGVSSGLPTDSTTLAAAEDETPSHLLTGSVVINRGGALLSAWLYEMGTGRLILSEQVTGTQEDLLMTLPEDLAHRLAAALQSAGPGG